MMRSMMRKTSCSRSTIGILLILLMCVAGPSRGRVAARESVYFQSEAVPLGLLDFQNESGASVSPELGQKMAQALQQKLVAAYADVLPRRISAPGDAGRIKALNVEELIALGKQNGVKYVVRGGLLGLASGNTSDGGVTATMQVYVDVISVDAATSSSFRASATGTQKGATSVSLQSGSIDLTSEKFQQSATGIALSGVIEQLGVSIHQAVASSSQANAWSTSSASSIDTAVSNAPTQDPTTETSSDANASPSSPADSEAAKMAETDDDLQQLVSETEQIISGGSGSSESLNALKKSLEGLKTALAQKASFLEQGKQAEVNQADQQIATYKQELQAVVKRIMADSSSGDQGTSDQTSGTGDQAQQSPERKNAVEAINDYLGQAVNIIGKIQEMRAAFRGAGQDQSASSYETGGTSEPSSGTTTSSTGDATEETLTDVNGAVTEDGLPVESATVTEPLSGASAVTAKDGSYTLKGLAAGRLTRLTVKQGSRSVEGSVDLLRGRANIADFQLRSKAQMQLPPLRVLPSAVILNATQGSRKDAGALKGLVQFANGQPMPRALVNLQGLALARTDTHGQYLFTKVPAGVYQMTVRRSGLRMKTDQVHILAGETAESRVWFVPGDSIKNRGTSDGILTAAAGAILGGVISDTQHRPLPGARVLVRQSARALSVLTSASGTYQFKQLKPGAYRLMASKFGYEDAIQPVTLQTDQAQRQDFQLKRQNWPFIAQVLENKSAGNQMTRDASGSDVRERLVAGENTGAKFGRLNGHIADARSGNPITRAIVIVVGHGRIMPNQDGSYVMANLPQGTYQVILRGAGFAEEQRTITIRAGQNVTLDFRVSPKPVLPVRRLSVGRDSKTG